MGEFGFHTADGGMEEESNEMLVSAFCANLFEGRDVGCAIFEANDEQGMISSKEDEVREQAASSAVAIMERMQILVIPMPFGCND